MGFEMSSIYGPPLTLFNERDGDQSFNSCSQLYFKDAGTTINESKSFFVLFETATCTVHKEISQNWIDLLFNKQLTPSIDNHVIQRVGHQFIFEIFFVNCKIIIYKILSFKILDLFLLL